MQLGGLQERLFALETGKVQGAMLPTPYKFIGQKRGFHNLVSVSLSYQSTGVSTTRTFIRESPDIVRKYIKSGVRPATSSLVGFASIYFWYLPSLGHPLFFYMIPFFHSLQYMLFIVAMKKNDAERAIQEQRQDVGERKWAGAERIGRQHRTPRPPLDDHEQRQRDYSEDQRGDHHWRCFRAFTGVT